MQCSPEPTLCQNDKLWETTCRRSYILLFYVSFICFLPDLDPSTTYEFRIRAYTDKGPGPWSDWTSIITPDPGTTFQDKLSSFQ